MRSNNNTIDWCPQGHKGLPGEPGLDGKPGDKVCDWVLSFSKRSHVSDIDTKNTVAYYQLNIIICLLGI